MKRLIFFALLSCIKVNAQTFPDFDTIKLVQASDYYVAEMSALQAADYLLFTPYDNTDTAWGKALQFLVKWMTGTPYFTFSLGNSINRVINKNDDLLVIYMTCMAKFSLEHPRLARFPKWVEINAVKLLLAYCENPANNIPMTKQLRKLWQANQKERFKEEM